MPDSSLHGRPGPSPAFAEDKWDRRGVMDLFHDHLGTRATDEGR